MDNTNIDQWIYDKYIAPTKNKKQRYIGIEIEMPIVNLAKKPVDEQVCLSVTEKFRKQFQFEIAGIDDESHVYSMTNDETGDNLSFDCAYSNLELSLGKGVHLHEIKERFEKYYLFLIQKFKEYNYTLTGMGINPNYNINHNTPILNERYRMLFHHLHTYKNYEGDVTRKFTNRADFGTFTSASQVQLDVDYENLVETINVFGLVEPYKMLLFGNSYMEEYSEQMAVRNVLWEYSMQGYNPHNIGMFDSKLASVEELLEYIKTTSIYCAMRDGKYVNFKPIPVAEYFTKDEIKAEFFNGKEYESIIITPMKEDLEHLRSFKFEDLTYRGTIEFRSACCQPISDSMTVAAFHVGLMNKLEEVEHLLESDTVLYGHGYNATELQKMMSLHCLPEFVNQEELSEQLVKLLDIAKGGLDQRGYQEEVFLEPLYTRAKHLTNPAKDMVKGLTEGKTIDYYIQEYGKVI